MFVIVTSVFVSNVDIGSGVIQLVLEGSTFV